MVDNEKQEHLANARRKLKQFRNQQQQQQPNASEDLTFNLDTNGIDVYSTNGLFNPSSNNNNTTSHIIPHDVKSFVNEQQAILSGIRATLSKSPVANLEEQNRQYALLIENQKQQRIRLEDQRQFGIGSSLSGRSSQNPPDIDFARQAEHKYRRELEQLQEQLEIHVQTIGVLVAEKTDLSAKLSQSVKQLERKQNEIDEFQGRLKASRERVDELEKHSQNTHKYETVMKESDKELERLKSDNSRQNQTIEDLKQNINELNDKYNNRNNIIDQLNIELNKLKQKLELSDIRLQQFQFVHDSSATNGYEQQIDELRRTLLLKTNEVEVLHSSINQMRSENDHVQLQYQQYNANVQRHIQELNDQINQLIQRNTMLENEQDALKTSYEMKLNQIQNDQIAHNNTNNTINNDLLLERDSLCEENQSFKNALDEWSRRYAEIRAQNEEIQKLLIEKDQIIEKLENDNGKTEKNSMDHEKLLQTIQDEKATLSRAIAQNKQLKDQLTELQDGFIKMSNDNMNLTTQIQSKEHINKQLSELLMEKEKQLREVQSISNEQNNGQMPTIPLDSQNTTQQSNELVEENRLLKERLAQVEEQQSKTETSNDIQHNDSNSLSSISSPIDETPRLENNFIEKIIQRFNRAMRDNADLQDRTQQLEHLILQLQSETDTIGDYISLYQQQRHQLHRRYQEKDEYIKQLTQDRLSLQRKLSELEVLLMRGLNKPRENIIGQQLTIENVATSSDQQQTNDENEWPELLDSGVSSSTTTEQTLINTLSSSPPSLSNFDDETKTRILTLLKELGDNNSSSPKNDSPSTIKLAFIDKNLYVCSTCSGPVQWV